MIEEFTNMMPLVSSGVAYGCVIGFIVSLVSYGLFKALALLNIANIK